MWNRAWLLEGKDKDNCLLVEYNPNCDYLGTSSGTEMKITIHTDNAYLTEKFEKITLPDVPLSIQKVLTYFKIENKNQKVDYKAKYDKCINVIIRFDAGII